MRRIVALFSLLLLAACTPPIYSQFCGDEREGITSFQSADDATRALLETSFAPYLNDTSPYVLQIQVVHALTCNNPQSVALGKDFDGYVRIALFKQGSCYWRAQQDFKAQGSQRALERLLQRFRSELLTAPEGADRQPHAAPDAHRQSV